MSIVKSVDGFLLLVMCLCLFVARKERSKYEDGERFQDSDARKFRFDAKDPLEKPRKPRRSGGGP